jgi:hypothetical protein
MILGTSGESEIPGWRSEQQLDARAWQFLPLRAKYK